MLGFILAAMTLVALGLLAWPFWTKRSGLSGTSADVYRDQLDEIDREEQAGIMAADDARMARIEVQRRLIAATGQAGEEGDKPAAAPRQSAIRLTYAAVAAIVALGSGLIYLNIGHPGLVSASGGGIPRPAVAESAQSIDSLIAQLEQRLAEHPDEAEGWRLLGWVKFQIEDYAAAITAYSRALEIEPDDARALSVYAEALIRANDGRVTDTARASLQQALRLDPAEPRARFLTGYVMEQAGDATGALNVWLDLLADVSPEEAWYGEIRDRVVVLARMTGTDISERLPPPPPRSGPGPTEDQIRAAEAMPPEEREAMIAGMVDRLEARLSENPGDLEGWIRLINARKTLGQTDQAASALENARAVFTDDPSALARLEAITPDASASP